MRKPFAIALSVFLAFGQGLAGQQAPAQTAPPAAAVITGAMNLNNASLVEVIDQLCRSLRINYVLDPRVKGSVTLNTYGETQQIDARNLLDLILRINGAAMIAFGDVYRIVPLTEAARMPLDPATEASSLVPDEQIVLNLMFLRYASAGEVSKLIEPFIGEGARVFTYAPANLLLVLDSRRSMRRTLEIISLFDSDTLAGQRVRLFEVRNGSPSAIAQELEDILKAISLAENNPVRLLPIDRINTIVAVAPNPGVFEEIEKWVRRLDNEAQVTVGSVSNYVYRVQYSQAIVLAGSIMQLYGAYGYYGGYGAGVQGYGAGAYPGSPYAQQGGGLYSPGMMPYSQGGFPPQYAPQYPLGAAAGAVPQGGTLPGAPAAGQDLTGTYLGGAAGAAATGRIPRVIPNSIDNSLLIQATPAEYQQILRILKQLDIPPRQVLIDAKIYEVSLTGAFASGVTAYLQQRGSSPLSPLGQLKDGVVGLSAGMLVGRSRELLAFLSLQENQTRAKVISAPSVIATDSLAASINVWVDVPMLTSQAVTPVQSGGSSLFANQIQNRSTGVSLNVMARVSPSGIVTLMINQEVSAPQAPAAGSIQSPSFTSRTINTQVTVQDGDTIAIGGIINESDASSSLGIPLLHRIPILGAAFGSRSYSKERTELIVFMTPRVIYDTNQMVDATEELKSRLKRLSRMIEE